MEQLFSSLPLEQLKTEISEDVFKKVASLIQTAHNQPKQTEFLTRKQAAELLGISLVTLSDWTKTGKITGYRIASRVRYKRAELETSLSQIKTGR
jgi:excisionase family DNA binding protein